MKYGLRLFGGLAVLVASASAQMMSPTEYKAFLMRLDDRATEWNKNIRALNIDQMNLSYAGGKPLAQFQSNALGAVDMLRKYVALEKARVQLSNEIDMLSMLKIIDEATTDLLGVLPERREAVSWGRSILPVEREMNDYSTQFEKHISDYADQLQAKAERCSH
jgi:hypothetical protein